MFGVGFYAMLTVLAGLMVTAFRAPDPVLVLP